MKAGEVAKLAQVGRSTLTQWTISEDFRDFFSHGARGGSGQERRFNELDVRIVCFIAESRRAKATIEEIVIALRAMQSNGWQHLPEARDVPLSAEFPVVPAAAADIALDTERRGFLREIASLQRQIDELNDALQVERENTRIAQEKRQADVERLLREREQMLREQAEIEAKLQASLARAEMELEFLRKYGHLLHDKENKDKT